MGAPLRRVGAILATAVAAVFVVVVGGFAVAAMTAGGRSTPAAVVTTPWIVPTASAFPVRSVTPVPAGPPAGALAALSGSAVVNARIGVDAAALGATLARKGAPTIEVARAIRSVASDAALGLDLTGRLAPWPDAAPVQAQLDAFYKAIAEKARAALRASLADAASYRRSGTELLRILRDLGAVDAASRTLAATVGLELPPVVLPGG